MRRGRSIVKWTLIVFGVLFVALVIAAIAGVGDENESSAKEAKNRPAARIGSRANPIPLGQAASVGEGWRLRVLSIVPNGDKLVLAVKNPDGSLANRPPPSGAQDFLVKLAATYTGGGKGQLSTFVTYSLLAKGSHNVTYDPERYSCGQWPKPHLKYVFELFSGQTAKGYVCFQVAKNDAATLKLYTEPDVVSGRKATWFALR